MENPYQSPVESSTPFSGQPSMDPFRRPGLVHHVRVVAILMIVQGTLELLAGIGCGVMAVVMPKMMAQKGMPHSEAALPPEQFFWVLYGGVAAVALLAAALHIVAGIQNLRFRGRTLGIVALAGGMLAVFTCYCFPTAVALGVYGLIVYLNAEAAEAFRMGDSGCSSSDIITAFR